MNKLGMLTIALAFGVNGCASMHQSQRTEETAMIQPKEVIKEVFVAFFEDYDEAEMRRLLVEDYIQHNPHVPDGLEPVLGLLPLLEEAEFSYELHRIIQDGPLVLTHATYSNAQVFGAETVVALDIWRVEEGKVTEHWDVITPLVTDTASGRSQTGGATEVVDLDKTQENKRLVEAFVTEVLIGEDFSRMDKYIRNGRYAQHNPLVEDGPEALQRVIAEAGLKNYKIHRVIGEGNFVLTQCEGEWNGKPMAIYDLFRVEDGFIVEHWDVIQEIPAEMAHDNGMF